VVDRYGGYRNGTSKENMNMNRIATALTLATAIAFAPVMTPLVQAKPKDATGVQIPVAGAVRGVTGEKFAGTFTLQQFVNDNGQVKAIGTIAGTVTDLAGNVVGTSLQNVAIPVTATQVSDPTLAAITAAAVCPILHLDLGPLTLNLLGLQVDLSRVILDITAIPGAGNLLGNLLCAVAGLLDPPNATGLAALLNQILAILSGLGL
jgi:hypothetical protein